MLDMGSLIERRVVRSIGLLRLWRFLTYGDGVCRVLYYYVFFK